MGPVCDSFAGHFHRQVRISTAQQPALSGSRNKYSATAGAKEKLGTKAISSVVPRDGLPVLALGSR